MTTEPFYNYTCPSCQQECSVADSLTGQNLTCPHCSQEFFATPPEASSAPIIPEKLPFFKMGRKKILAERLEQLVADGELNKEDERELAYLAASLGLDKSDLNKIQGKKFMREFNVIKARVESRMMLSDDDLAEIRAIEKKYDVQLTIEGEFQTLRWIYLMEVKKQLPPTVQTDLMLGDEPVYFRTPTTWGQMRVKNGSEGLLTLSEGTLYVTAKRLLFNGTGRNTTINISRIIDCGIYSDALRIEKNSGKPDYFTMRLPRSRYIIALLAALK